METLLLPLALMCLYPRNVFVLRGNHECFVMSQIYGFLGECRCRYSTHIFAAACKVFDCMPLAAIIGSDVFAVHGGLSPQVCCLPVALSSDCRNAADARTCTLRTVASPRRWLP